MNNIIERIQEIKNRTDLNFNVKTYVENFTVKIFDTLFNDEVNLTENFDELEFLFKKAANASCEDPNKLCEQNWEIFAENIPTILEQLNNDAQYFLDSDPAAKSIEEIYLAYPGFYAIAIYRFSHIVYGFGLTLFARLMSEFAHRETGTEIHPGATIASPFFIDHATGIVIGETVQIAPYVKIYQGVTLGALSVSKDKQNTKRHPTVASNVCIYANATILGGETVIGKNTVVGGNVWVTESTPENSIVYSVFETKIKTK